MNSLTLGLLGNVSLIDFDSAVGRLRSLLDGLAQEIGQGPVGWLIQDLEAGSAQVSVLAAPEVDADTADLVVRAFGRVGESLERNEPVIGPPRVRRDTDALRAMLNGKVTALQFETPEITALVTTSVAAQHEEQAPLPKTTIAFGAIRGQVQTLSSRGTLHFTLYDDVLDKPISCYLSEGQEELIRGVWGRPAIVAGVVTRDRLTGRPLTIRRIDEILTLQQVSPDDWRGAAGISPALHAVTPEDAIRRLRDAS